MSRVLVSLIVVGSLCAAPAAFAQGAKPDNPSGFGELVRGSVPLGTLASESATNGDTPGAAFEVQKGLDEEGSTPNLPPTTP